MAQKHVLRYSSIYAFFKNEERLILRGENAVESNHIENMMYDGENSIIRGDVYASMKIKKYKVEIYLTSENLITHAVCTCPRGQVLCHHMAALAIFAHYNISVTDASCSWSVRRSKESQTKTIQEIFVPKVHKATRREITQKKIDQLAEELSKFNGAVGFTWLLSTAPSSDFDKVCVDVEAIINSNEYCSSSQPEEYLKDKLKLTLNEITTIFHNTIGQFKNDNWLMCRKNRLTASKFGIVLAAVRRKRFTEALFKQLAEYYNLDGVRAIQWGRTHEAAAIKMFEDQIGKKVEPCGIWLHECGFLGASPDGLVEDAVLEVKCPYKYREQSLYEGIKNDNNYIIKFETDSYLINKKHNYYHQIQGQLWILNKRVCHLLIWTPSECILLDVETDNEWENNINVLQQFYINYYIKQLAK